MDGVIVLIAHGANDLQMPCRVFPNMKVAKLVCDGIFGIKGEETEKGSFRYKVDLESEEEPWPISKQLFTSFYYGCGGPYRFTIEEVGFDATFIHWDLD